MSKTYRSCQTYKCLFFRQFDQDSFYCGQGGIPTEYEIKKHTNDILDLRYKSVIL
jgi:hypothetical protein